MTTHRLRSNKGSFVRSPKLAFESAEETLVSAGTVTAFEDTAALVVHQSFCSQTTTQNAAPHGVDWLQFNWSSGGGLTHTQLLETTYTGLTSGATFRPADMGGGVDALCTSGNFAFYEQGSSVAVLGGDVYQWYARMRIQAGLAAAVAYNWSNWGRFLTRLPVPGSGLSPAFIDGENFGVPA